VQNAAKKRLVLINEPGGPALPAMARDVADL
jgi:hypothetical protein